MTYKVIYKNCGCIVDKGQNRTILCPDHRPETEESLPMPVIKNILYAKEVAKLLKINVIEIGILSKYLGVKKIFGGWRFTQADVEKLHLFITGQFILKGGEK